MVDVNSEISDLIDDPLTVRPLAAHSLQNLDPVERVDKVLKIVAIIHEDRHVHNSMVVGAGMKIAQLVCDAVAEHVPKRGVYFERILLLVENLL